MNNIELIRNKLRKELQDFEAECEKRGVKYTLQNAYQYTIMGEFLFRYDECMEDEDIQEALDSDRYVKYIYEYALKHDNLLEHLYYIWCDCDVNIGETLTDTVEYQHARIEKRKGE